MLTCIRDCVVLRYILFYFMCGHVVIWYYGLYLYKIVCRTGFYVMERYIENKMYSLDPFCTNIGLRLNVGKVRFLAKNKCACAHKCKDSAVDTVCTTHCSN